MTSRRYRNGFVVVRDVLTTDQAKFPRHSCEREAKALKRDAHDFERHLSRALVPGMQLPPMLREMFDLVSEHRRWVCELVVTGGP